MSDKTPDRRFAMISLEMEGEDGPRPAVQGGPDTELLVSGAGVVCPRCLNGAFEPGLDKRLVAEGVQSVRCLGCPDNPWYPLPSGVQLGVHLTPLRYRCEGCGVRCQVTMTLPEVNLYCPNCKRLAIHVKDVPARPAPERPPEARRRLTPAARQRLDEMVTRATQIGRERTRERTGPSVITDGVNDVQIDARDPVLVNLTRTMMSIIGLEDFDEYAARKRRENLAPWRDQERNERLDEVFGVTGPPGERRTGRTTRGILELLARHYLATTRPTVWVLGGRPQIDVWLRGEVHRLRRMVGNDHPERVEVAPEVGRLIARQLKPPAGVMLYVDHTYYETNGRRGEGMAGITYRPD